MIGSCTVCTYDKRTGFVDACGKSIDAIVNFDFALVAILAQRLGVEIFLTKNN